ncbi:unnamed protein product [Nezara viridula]|uniref:Uncharacterized protein n=1 Tax=Nezara viridula TaxID=85310 RepID=A0A9P0H422_NEZVI|nr:unnamed protein product [Nezara viridula]
MPPGSTSTPRRPPMVPIYDLWAHVWSRAHPLVSPSSHFLKSTLPHGTPLLQTSKRITRCVLVVAFSQTASTLTKLTLPFILEEPPVTSYVSNYISQIESGLSKLLRDAAEDCQWGNLALKDKFRIISNVFIRSSLMSAREAANLSLPVSKSSRKVISINTSPQDELTVMLKKHDVEVSKS